MPKINFDVSPFHHLHTYIGMNYNWNFEIAKIDFVTCFLLPISMFSIHIYIVVHQNFDSNLEMESLIFK